MTSNKINNEFWQDFDKILSITYVPCFSASNIRPCDDNDFKNFRNDLQVNLTNLNLKLDLLLEDKNKIGDKLKKKLLNILIVAGENSILSPWNTRECITESSLMLSKVCNFFNRKDLQNLFEDDLIFVTTVRLLRPKLLKDTWKKYPSAVLCFQYFINAVGKPLLKEHLHDLLPTTLIIMDDYVEDNQVVGLTCLKTILEHCQGAKSLQISNFEEVLYEKLKIMTYKASLKTILILYTCINDLLEIMNEYGNSGKKFSWCKSDEILEILFDKMELQVDDEYRHTYLKCLLLFITRSSIGKWTNRLASILSEYCISKTNLDTLSLSYDALEKLLLIYQPLNKTFYILMYPSLMKMIIDIKDSEITDQVIIDKIYRCLNSLKSLSPHLYDNVLKDYEMKTLLEAVEEL